MLFLDATVLVGVADAKDDVHADGVATWRALAEGALGQAHVTDLVIAEAVTILGRRPSVGAARTAAFAEGVLTSDRIDLLPVDGPTCREALALYRRFGPALSFSDVATVVQMHKMGCRTLYSHDRGFDRIPGMDRRERP